MGRPRKYKVCPECKKEFYGGRKYCSDSCTMAAGKPVPKKLGEYLNCENCGNEIYVALNRLKNVEHYFCNLQCQIEWQSRNKIERICETCDKKFYVSPSRIKYDAVRFCSVECRDLHPDSHQHLLNINQLQQMNEQTSIETIGYSILDNIGVNYISQHIIDNKFCVDAYIPDHRLIIQFDGDYWHANPNKFTELDARQQKRVNVDRSQEKYFAKHNYSILRFWGSQLRQDTDYVRDEIEKTIRYQTNSFE